MPLNCVASVYVTTGDRDLIQVLDTLPVSPWVLQVLTCKMRRLDSVMSKTHSRVKILP